jgi:hypothetical protein
MFGFCHPVGRSTRIVSAGNQPITELAIPALSNGHAMEPPDSVAQHTKPGNVVP